MTNKKTCIRTYSHVTVSAIIMNYVIGTGILNLPHTIAHASLVTSFIFITLISLTSYLLAYYAFDALTRTLIMEQQSDVEEPLLKSESGTFVIPNNRTIQMSRLCSKYYGTTGFIIYQSAMIVSFAGTLLGYS